MPAPRLDGSLAAWSDLASRYSAAALLCGNGLSVNVWPAFGRVLDQFGEPIDDDPHARPLLVT
jgi:hypothetical protein